MFPRLLRRIQAVLIDSIITPVVLISSIMLAGYLSLDSSFARGVLSFGPALSMEPLLVALTGGTIGHHIIGIKVRYANKDKNISIFHALFRFILKIFFGLPSLIFVLVTKRHQAIHDILSQAIVVHKSTDNLPTTELLKERIIEEDGYDYPSALRRVFVIFSYITLFLFIYGILIMLLMSDKCIEHDTCNNIDTMISKVSAILFWASVAFFIITGWKSKLYGCRRKRKAVSN